MHAGMKKVFFTYWQVKLPVALVGAGVWDLFLDHAVEDRVAVAALLVLVGLDLVTGLVRAVQQRERITARRFRGTLRKVFEYAALVVVFVVLDAAAAGGTYAGLADFANESVLIFMCLTEGLSIAENLGRLAWLYRLLRFAGKLRKGDEVAALRELDPVKKNVTNGMR